MNRLFVVPALGCLWASEQAEACTTNSSWSQCAMLIAWFFILWLGWVLVGSGQTLVTPVTGGGLEPAAGD